MNDKKFLIIMALILIVLIVISWLGQNNNKETETTIIKYTYKKEGYNEYCKPPKFLIHSIENTTNCKRQKYVY